MARKQKVAEHENHERWLVSYADFITLLFAFFVVMYSISSVNEGKYRVLSSTMASAFTNSAKSLDPIQQGRKIREPIIQHKAMGQSDKDKKRVGVEHEIMPTPKEIAQMQKLADEIQHKLQKLVDNDEIKVSKTNKGVEIEIKSNILFSSGQAFLQSRAKQILVDIADILSISKNPINVEGFTDNVPIKTAMFPSNWELSAARAANVANLFSSSGINPIRLSAIGYGQFQPVADNATARGRRMNRRINVVVLNRMPTKRKRIPSLNKRDKKTVSENNKLPFVNLFTLEDTNNREASTQRLSIDKKAGGSVQRIVGKPIPQKIISLGGETKKTNQDQAAKPFKKPTLFALPPPTLLDN